VVSARRKLSFTDRKNLVDNFGFSQIHASRFRRSMAQEMFVFQEVADKNHLLATISNFERIVRM
jgi:hypothetical protein